MRKPTEPGGYSMQPGSVGLVGSSALGSIDPDDVPTKPEGVCPETLALVRVIGDMNTVEKRKVVRLLQHWVRCGLGRRVLIEELARELAQRKE